MNYIIKKTAPYIIMNGKPLSDDIKKVDKEEFFSKLKEVIGDDNFAKHETKIMAHLSVSGNYISFGDNVFTCE